MTNQTVALTNIETKEIAKEVRKELKQLYPKIKFSVRSDFNTIRIEYTDGVTADDVEAVAKKYSGRSGWDSNYCDYTTNSPVVFRGEMVYTSLVYVFVTRNFSPSFLQEVVDYVKATYANHESIAVQVRKDDTAYLDSNDWEVLCKYREVAHRCTDLLSIAIQEKLRKSGEEEYQDWKQQVDIATALLEEELQQEGQAVTFHSLSKNSDE
ncbi:LPD29 domain-containing protein [Halotia wernerae UHCC 0503]|nr:LPD29 domain-containing protein [Halotia wernerae UHCC 0503]